MKIIIVTISFLFMSGCAVYAPTPYGGYGAYGYGAAPVPMYGGYGGWGYRGGGYGRHFGGFRHH